MVECDVGSLTSCSFPVPTTRPLSTLNVFSLGKVFVEPTPQIEKQFKDELAKAQHQYASEGSDMNQFPDFKFAEPNIDPIETTSK